MVKKIVSGGQTGADRAGLDVALELGLETGGWVPRGRRAEDGAVPAKYAGLRETPSDAYEERTLFNVRDSDATVIVTFGTPAGGSALTARSAESLGRPVLTLDLDRYGTEEAAAILRAWLEEVRPETLNVAGPRAGEEPRTAEVTAAVLMGALGPGIGGRSA